MMILRLCWAAAERVNASMQIRILDFILASRSITLAGLEWF